MGRAKVNRPLRLRILELLAQRSDMTFTDIRVAVIPSEVEKRGVVFRQLDKLRVLGAITRKPVVRRDDSLCHHTYSLSNQGYVFIEKYRQQIVEEGQEEM